MTPHRDNGLPVKPMLAMSSKGKRGRQIALAELDGTHAFELKIDGVRAIVQWDGRELHVWNRNGVRMDGLFPEVEAAVREQPPVTMDGELVLRGSDVSFNDLAKRIKNDPKVAARLAEQYPAQFVAFDLPLQEGSYVERRATLITAVTESECLSVVTASFDGQAMFDHVKALGLEGVIAKRLNGRYQPGRRSPDWVKFKTTTTLTCVAIGYEPGNGSRAHFGAMHLAVVADHPVYVGRVGTGFDATDIAWLKSRLDAGEMPLVEIECLGRTRDNKLRFPVYLGPRTDLSVLDASVDQLDALPIQ